MQHSDYINKQVPLKFSGQSLKFNLSQALFSSFSIDAGTSMLLKTVAQKVNLDELSSVYDIGCGVGVIGLALKKRCPDADVLVQDRDALAVEFTKNNASLNGIDGVEYSADLALQGVEGRKFDLILSNIPAKAGEKVLMDFFSRSGSFLTEKGRCAVVIVAPLAQFAKKMLDEIGCEILHEEFTSQYTVFHYRGFNPEKQKSFNDYIRNKDTFELNETEYYLETTYNIPNFDTPGYSIELAADMLTYRKVKGKALFVNPGQGHIPVFMDKKKGNDISQFILAGRDTLQLEITEHNLLQERERSEVIKEAVPYVDYLSLKEESVDFFYIEISPTPKVNWYSCIMEAARKVLKPGGMLFIMGKSTPMHTLLKETKGFTPSEDRKYRGTRASIYFRNR